MNAVRTNYAARAIVIAMTLLGWFVLSNHCALGQMSRSTQGRKAHACCQNGESKQEQQPTDGKQGLECCKALHVVLPVGAKADVSPATFLVAVLVTTLTLEDQTVEPVVLACDSGPPRAASFSELVLHRSLRAHAPPFLS